MTKRVLISGVLTGALMLLACEDEPLGPERYGSIVIELATPSPAVAPADVDTDSVVTTVPADNPIADNSGRRTIDGEAPDDSTAQERDARSSAQTGAARVHFALVQAILKAGDGSIIQTVELAVSATTISGQITGVDPGTYTVQVEAFIGTDLDYFGLTSVTVVAGSNATATIQFESFQPDLSGFTIDTTTGSSVVITFPPVSNASGYQVQVATDQAFTMLVVDTMITATSYTLDFSTTGTFYFRIRALTNATTSTGRWSDVRSVTVAPVVRINIIDGGGQAGEVASVLPTVPVIEATDNFGAILTGLEVTFTANSGSVAVAIDTTDGSGLASPGLWTLGTVATTDSDSVKVVVAGLDSTYVTATATAAPPAGLAINVIPTGAAARTDFTIGVDVQDQYGNLVDTATTSVSVELSQNNGQLLLRNASFGVAPTVWTVDHATPNQTSYGVPPGSTVPMNAMAYDPATAQVIGMSAWDDNTYTIDPANPAGGWTLVASHSAAITTVSGMSWNDVGTALYATERSNFDLYDINPTTGMANGIIGTVTGLPGFGFSAFAIDPTTNMAYGAINNGSGNTTREFVSINLTTLAGTVIGVFPENGVSDLVFLNDGTLLAVTGFTAFGTVPANKPEMLFVVDKANGAMTPRLKLDFGDGGMAIAAFPSRLTGTVTTNAVAGRATFNNVQIDAPGNGFTVRAYDSGLNDGFSAPFDVGIGTPELTAVHVVMTPVFDTIVGIDSTIQVTAEAFDYLGNAVGETFAWSTSNGSVASVDGNGVVTAVGQASSNGVTIVRATIPNGVSDTTSLKVQVPTAMTIQQDGAAVTGVGATQSFNPELRDLNGDLIAGSRYLVNWESLNPNVATASDAVLPGNDDLVLTVAGNGQVIARAEAFGVTGYGVVTASVPMANKPNIFQGVSTATSSFWGLDAWGVDGNDFWLGGTDGGVSFASVQRYDGAWTSDPLYDGGGSAPPGYFWRLWGTAANDIYGASERNPTPFAHYDGNAWTPVVFPSAVDGPEGIWAASPEEVYFGVTDGNVVRLRNGVWDTAYTAASGLSAAWGSAADNIWFAGDAGTFVHWDGNMWTEASSVAGVTAQIRDLWGTGPTDIWAVSQAGDVLHYDGTWATVATPPTGVLWRVWGTSPSDVYAVGSLGMIWYDGGQWRPGGRAFVSLFSAWGGHDDDMWLFGGEGSFSQYRGLSGGSVAIDIPIDTLLGSGAAVTLSATALDNGGGALSDVSMQWTSDNGSVASVSNTGVVTTGSGGVTNIIATALGGAADTSVIIVADAVAAGNTVNLGSSINWSGDVYLSNTISLTNKTLVTNLGMIAAGAGGNAVLGLYTDDGSGTRPETLVVQTAQFAIGAAGTYEFVVPTIEVGPGTYWLTVQYSVTTLTAFAATPITPLYYTFATYSATMPTTYSLGTYDTITYGPSNWYLRGFELPLGVTPPQEVILTPNGVDLPQLAPGTPGSGRRPGGGR